MREENFMYNSFYVLPYYKCVGDTLKIYEFLTDKLYDHKLIKYII